MTKNIPYKNIKNSDNLSLTEETSGGKITIQDVQTTIKQNVKYET